MRRHLPEPDIPLGPIVIGAAGPDARFTVQG
jgi:hypothetical protein